METIGASGSLLGCEEGPITGLPPYPKWKITYPYLKLALKYGVVGQWKGEFNREVLFDAYALSRGPEKTLPNVADLAMTMLMNSYVEHKDLATLERWLAKEQHVATLMSLAESLRAYPAGLQDMTPEAIERLGAFVDELILDNKNMSNFRGAKIFKWLSAWASFHVPMIDNELHEALAGYKPHDAADHSKNPQCPQPSSRTGFHFQRSSDLITAFQRLLVSHLSQLETLGTHLTTDLAGLLPCSPSPVRLLDGLIWFDWCGCRIPGFEKWLKPEGEWEIEVMECGIQFLEERRRNRR